jgi:hypothetical protein
MIGMPTIGHAFEAALWFNADRTSERPDARRGVTAAIKRMADANGAVFGPIAWEILAPGDERVPEPPPHFSGRPRLMVGYAEIVALAVRPMQSRFTDDLEPRDLQRLRAATQEAYIRRNPKAPALDDDQLDAIVNEVGPGAAVRQLRMH